MSQLQTFEVRFNKRVKVTKLFAEKNVYYVQNGINGAYLGPKSTLLKFLLNFSWKFYKSVPNDRHQKVGKSDSSEFLRKILIIAKMGKNGSYLSPKLALMNFSVNLFIRFFWKYIWWYALNSSIKWLFCRVKENSLYT